jgi:hypothetical protein
MRRYINQQLVHAIDRAKSLKIYMVLRFFRTNKKFKFWNKTTVEDYFLFE